MPTILRIDGLRIAIYPNDHPPAHVHVIGADFEIVINLSAMEIRESIGCPEFRARDIVKRLAPHRIEMLAA
jgi:Domain of unknown function (DUF4160)